MSSEPPAPMTLGNAAAARVRLLVWCKACAYRSEHDPAEQARWDGPGTPVPEFFVGGEERGVGRCRRDWPLSCSSLKAISQWLDRQRTLVRLVAGDLRRQGLRETGGRGLPAETVLRCNFGSHQGIELGNQLLSGKELSLALFGICVKRK